MKIEHLEESEEKLKKCLKTFVRRLNGGIGRLLIVGKHDVVYESLNRAR